VSVAAFLGLAVAHGDTAAPLILDAFKSADVKWQNAATEAARAAKGDKTPQALLAQLTSLPQGAQALLIGVFADRGYAAALPSVTTLAASPDPAVRLAALHALGPLGKPSSVSLLAMSAASADATEADAARVSLYTLRGADVDSAIGYFFPTSETSVKTQLIRALAARNAADSDRVLLMATSDPDESVRAEAFTALGALSKPDQLPALTDRLVNVQGEKARAEAETAVVNVAQKITTENTRASAVLTKLPAVKSDAKAQASLLRVLGRIGDDGALPAIRSAANDSNAEVSEAALRALAGWSNDAVLPDLQRLAQKGGESERLIAVRGFLHVLTLPSKRSEEQTLQLYETALRFAPSPAEKKTALAGLANVHTERVKTVVKPFLNDPQYSAEAQAALGKLAKTTITASASDNDAEAKLAIDGKVDTRWSSGAPQKPGQWFQLDLGWERSVSKITLDSTPSAGDYPRGYEVYVSKDSTDLGKPVAKGNGNGPITEIRFASKDGRYIRIVQAGTEAGLWWSIHEIRVDSQ
ncbi:MAG: HEAT repeat domain-containing protein, partial [Candidatus Hydrogenedentes bacterium]|nr:HEAT repeat domain-containing protein [Candidatus Hydrogenedentota bacterium]